MAVCHVIRVSTSPLKDKIISIQTRVNRHYYVVIITQWTDGWFHIQHPPFTMNTFSFLCEHHQKTLLSLLRLQWNFSHYLSLIIQEIFKKEQFSFWRCWNILESYKKQCVSFCWHQRISPMRPSEWNVGLGLTDFL